MSTFEHLKSNMIFSDPVKKRLLILGGGSDQIPLYEAAQNRGLHIIGIDRNQNAAARLLADEFYHIGIDNPDLILTVLNHTPVDGLVSPASDAGHRSVYEISRRLDLPFQPSLPAVTCSMHKAFFLQQIAALGLPCYEYFYSDNLDELLSASSKMEYPLVVKPVDSSGSKGITLVLYPENLETALRHAKQFSSVGEVILEQFLTGIHYGVEAFRLHGETILLAISQKIDVLKSHFQTVQHFMSPVLPENLQQSIENAFHLICNQLSIANGPVNLDFILKEGKIYFHDFGARLGGNGLSDLVKLAYGVDLPELTIRLVLGENLADQFFLRKRIRYAGLHMLAATAEGSFLGLHGLKKLETHPAFTGIKLFVRPGDHVLPFVQASHKLGYILASHESAQAAQDLLSFAGDEIRVMVEPSTA
jgi:biotin carboxylase